MVKVQKPKPKTLSNVGNLKPTIVKKKNADKLQKPTKSGSTENKKKAIAKNIEKVLANDNKDKKVKGETKINKEKTEVKKEKHNKVLPKEPLAAPTPTPMQPKEKKQKKPKIKQETETVEKKPLNLAPASPAPVGKAVKKGKKSDAQVAVIVEKSLGGVVAPKQQQKNKKSKVKSANSIKTEEKSQKKAVSGKANANLQKKKESKKAARKNNLKSKKTKKQKTLEAKFEAVPFDEDKFNTIVCGQNICKIAKALKIQVEAEVEKKKTSIFSDYRYMLNIAYFKIPNCPKRMVKLNLKHSLVDKDDDVLIVVPDLKRGGKVEWEPTIQHYEDLFRESGVEGLKLTIMPFNQLRNEYNSFESVRKLGSTYDFFLCDGRLMGQLAGFTGKVFQTPRRTFQSVRLHNIHNIKNEITKSLKRTSYRQIAKGDLISIPVGNHKYTIKQLSENIEYVISQLKTILPGGWPNMRGIYLKIDITGTSSLPIYLSTAQPPEKTPNVVGPREERMHKLKKEANAVLEKFAITKDADVVSLTPNQVERKKKFKEAQAALLAEKASEPSTKPMMDDDGEESAVPAKKARKEDKSDVEKDIKKKKEVEEEEAEDDSEASGDDDEDDDSEGGDEGEEDDDDDDDDAEDDDEDGDEDDDDEDGEGDDDEEDDE